MLSSPPTKRGEITAEEEPTTVLCATCQKVLHTPVKLDEERRSTLLLRSYTYDLFEGAESGCELCLLFLASTNERKRQIIKQQLLKNPNLSDVKKYVTDFEFRRISREGETNIGLSMTFCKPLEYITRQDREGDTYEEYFNQVLLTPAGTLSSIPTADSKTGSRRAMSIVKRWIHNCENFHKECQVWSAKAIKSPRPTRLLYVGTHQNPCLRVCENVSAGALYATVSHCWGGKQSIQLQQSSLNDFREDIPISQVPKTFLDAIQVCRTLEIQYLWIDSLCIIQDSKEDWMKECALMYLVYSNAIVNISATSSTDSGGGLFYDRNPRSLQSGPIKLGWSSNYNGTYIALPQDASEVFQFRGSPLNSRAWVCQERLLSLRNLHFTKEQLFWECRQLTACELMPEGIPESFFRSDFLGMPKRLTVEHGAKLRLSDRLPSDASLNAYAIWAMILKAYTNSELTYGTDKLIAISALARHCQTYLGLEGYLAGLWKPHLAYQLLWVTYPGNFPDLKKERTHCDYRAPTWSWASADGYASEFCDIGYANDREIIINVNEVQVMLKSSDPFGQVTDGFLVISGRLAKVAVCEEIGMLPKYTVKISLDCLVPTKGQIWKDVSYRNVLELGFYDNLYFLPVRKYTGRHFSRFDALLCKGLLLQSVKGNKVTFSRFGVYLMDMGSDGELFEQAFAHFDLYAEESGLEFSRNGEQGNVYTIKII